MSDTNKKITKVASLIGVGALVLVVTVFVLDQYIKEDDYKSSKVIEVKESVLRGFRKGRKSWQILVDYAWAGQSKYLFRGNKIHSGTVFDSQSKIVLKDLSADEVKVNTKSKNFDAIGGINATFIRRDRQPRPGRDYITVKAGKYAFFNATQSSYLEDNVVLTLEDKTIIPGGRAEIDHEKNQVTIVNGFSFSSDDFKVTANTIVIDIDKEIGYVSGNIKGHRRAQKLAGKAEKREAGLSKKPTSFTADKLTYYFGADEKMISRKNVKIWQTDKTIKCDLAEYKPKSKTFLAKGNIRATSTSLKWLIKPDTTPKHNKEVSQIVNSATDLRANQLRFNRDAKRLEVEGKVRLKQNNLSVSSGKLVYDDARKQLIFTKKVHLKRKEYEVKSESLVIDIDNEIGFVSGNITGKRQAEKAGKQFEKREAQLRKKPTGFKAGYITHWFGKEEKIRLRKNVKIDQPDKSLRCDIADYFIKSKDFVATGNIHATSKHLNWLINLEGKPTKNKEVREILESPTKLEAQRLKFNGDKKILEVEGSIFITQEKMTLRCQKLSFDDANQQIVFRGDVQLKRSNGQLITAQTVILDIESEEFSADDEVRFKFKLTDRI